MWGGDRKKPNPTMRNNYNAIGRKMLKIVHQNVKREPLPRILEEMQEEQKASLAIRKEQNVIKISTKGIDISYWLIKWSILLQGSQEIISATNGIIEEAGSQTQQRTENKHQWEPNEKNERETQEDHFRHENEKLQTLITNWESEQRVATAERPNLSTRTRKRRTVHRTR